MSEQFWHTGELSKLHLMFPEWEIWWVRKGVLQHRDESWFTWHARPHGALRSACDADSPGELATKIARYIDNRPVHIAAARQDLERTPRELPYLQAAIQQELQS